MAGEIQVEQLAWSRAPEASVERVAGVEVVDGELVVLTRRGAMRWNTDTAHWELA